jgi:hypothetical protein
VMSMTMVMMVMMMMMTMVMGDGWWWWWFVNGWNGIPYFTHVPKLEELSLTIHLKHETDHVLVDFATRMTLRMTYWRQWVWL